MDDQDRRLLIGCGIILGLALFFSLLLGIFFRGGVGRTSTPVRILSASADVAGTTLAVGNQDSFPWTDCRLGLNDDYRYSAAHVEAEDVLTLPLALFAKRDGTRFDPLRTKPVSLTIRCAEGNTYLRWR